MSKKLYNEVRTLLNETRGKIVSMVSEDVNPAEVYEVVFQVFPVTSMTRGVAKAGKGGAQ